MEKKRLRIDGIPTDISEERVKDKLTIHFLRKKNGGGEMETIDIIPGPPPYAIVTFEDDEVAKSVLRIKTHTLQTYDKTYKLLISEAVDKLELDEVFQKMSLTVHYKRFPENCRNVLKNLRKTHKDVKFDYNEKLKMCEISGTYTEMQTLVQEIVKKLESAYKSEKLDLPDTQQNRKSAESVPRNPSDPVGLPQAADERFVPLYARVDETKYVQKNEITEQLHEPIVWDSDIFKYIQQFHKLEYQEILSKYHVHSVDESSDGITTIYLQTLNRGQRNQTNLRGAQFDLMGLYQGLELLLRKEQIDKKDIKSGHDIQKSLLKDLQTLYPMLLCHEDEQYLFLIGSASDVAQGKQFLIDIQSKFDIPSTYGTQPSGSLESTMTEGLLKSLSPSYKHERHESKVGNRIAATFSLPADHSSYSTRSHLDERYLTSKSGSIQLPDYEKYLSSNKPAQALVDNTTFSKTEDLSLLQTDERLGTKSLPSFKKLDVLPALKTGREEIRQSRSNPKNTGPLKPVMFTKASSELSYSSLVDVEHPPFDFKIPEGRLKRSNSLSRIYSRDSALSPIQTDTFPFKDEILVEDWLWHYIKELHKSDIDIVCTEVMLVEEQNKGNIILKLKAVSKTKLTFAKEKIQLLCWKESTIVSSFRIQYYTLGIKGPDDSAINDYCSLFRSLSQQLCIKLEEDNLLLIYPKSIQQRVIEGISHMLNRIKSHFNVPSTLAEDNSSSLHRETVEERNKPDSSTEDHIGKLNSNSLSEEMLFSTPQPQPLSSVLGGSNFDLEINDYQGTRSLKEQKPSHFDGTDILTRITSETKTFFNSTKPPNQDKSIQISPQSNEHQDHVKGNNLLQGPEYFQSKSNVFENFQTNLYTQDLHLPDFKADLNTFDQCRNNANDLLSETFNLPSEALKNPANLEKDNGEEGRRSPAVGQESEMIDMVCGICNRSTILNKLSCGHYMCESCQSSAVDLCYECSDSTLSYGKKTMNVNMAHKSMSLSLSGYERDTSWKIIYDVSDGVQGVEDPNPGCQYKGGRFEAYLPDNREGNRLLLLLEKALKKGLTFQIKTMETGDKVTWHRIPHKTSPDGGKLKNGYPDSTYIKSTITLLKELGIE